MPLSKIVANSITDNTITTDQIADTSVHGQRNLTINGAMQVAQRGAAGGTVTNTAGYRSVDRYKTDIDGSGGGDFSHAQVEDAPLGQGFKYASKITTVTQASQPTSESNRHQFYTLLEKQNTFHLDWGTSAAKTCTLSFWVKGSVTGIYNMMFAHYGGSGGSTATYYYFTNYTINSANTWEKKTITVTGPTVGGNGVNERDDTTFGTRIEWAIGIGSDAETGTLEEWTTSSTYRTAPNSVYLPENAGATLYITGVQFEVGDKATPFEHRSFGDELARCQRYYQRYNSSSGKALIFAGDVTSGDNYFFNGTLVETMRTAPTLSLIGSLSDSGFNGATFATEHMTTSTIRAYATSSSTGARRYFQFNCDLDAEL